MQGICDTPSLMKNMNITLHTNILSAILLSKFSLHFTDNLENLKQKNLPAKIRYLSKYWSFICYRKDGYIQNIICGWLIITKKYRISTCSYFYGRWKRLNHVKRKYTIWKFGVEYGIQDTSLWEISPVWLDHMWLSAAEWWLLHWNIIISNDNTSCCWLNWRVPAPEPKYGKRFRRWYPNRKKILKRKEPHITVRLLIILLTSTLNNSSINGYLLNTHTNHISIHIKVNIFTIRLTIFSNRHITDTTNICYYK